MLISCKCFIMNRMFINFFYSAYGRLFCWTFLCFWSWKNNLWLRFEEETWLHRYLLGKLQSLLFPHALPNIFTHMPSPSYVQFNLVSFHFLFNLFHFLVIFKQLFAIIRISFFNIQILIKVWFLSVNVIRSHFCFFCMVTTSSLVADNNTYSSTSVNLLSTDIFL